ncbi:ATP-binding cassette sub-family B member 9 [Strongyloides ratti]|uniref:ATP-binding cassette sub-family B member 9 n=1 Tax=Strongyloides ratti TaxID=34506 RepID=A0A090LKK0_STRRB|nr:ATP-binding cassette sub-family B member 9 [Strongyloides ratti]CEF68673.1 ATP-binding cassette sub-family B member 9 [Strongyloides ratti]
MGTVFYSPKQALVITFVFSIIDIFINLLGLTWNGSFFTLGNLIHWFSWKNYDFTKNPVDFFFIGLIRILILFLGSIYLYFHGKSGAVTCAKWSNPIFAFLLLLIAFSPSKMLAFYEHSDPKLVIGDWILMGWCIIASFASYGIWTNIFCKTRKIDDGGEDRRRLVDDDGFSDDDDNNSGSAAEEYFKSVQNEAEEKELKQRETFSMLMRLFSYMGKEGPFYFSAFFFLFLFALSKVFTPYYTGEVVASVIHAKAGDYSALNKAVLIMTILSLAGALFGGLRGASFTYAQARVDRRIRDDLFRSIVNQEIGYFDGNQTGEICSRLNADCQTMSNTLSLYMNVLTRNLTMLVGSLIFMFSLSWRLSMVTFIAIPLIFFVSKVFGVYYDVLAEETQDSVAKSNAHAEEILSAIRTVKSFACEKFEAKRFLGFLDATLKIGGKRALVIIGYIWVLEIFQMGILTAVLFYGGHLVLKGDINVGLLVSFMLYQFQLGENMRELSEVFNGLMQAVGASRKVFEMIDRKPIIRNNNSGFMGSAIDNDNNSRHSGDGERKPTRGRIEFKNVRFAYPTRPDIMVMNGVSFTVEPGEVVALVGPSGGGKSSCISLLEHFYEPLSGEVLLDGINIKDYNHKYLHKKIALVGQEPILYSRAVHENISYGCDEVCEDKIIEAAKMANAHDFIMGTVDGYETNVGEKGSTVSGGQKQRIAISRALVRDPDVLLLDEATSALDSESEALVQEAIAKNLKTRTVLLIAHRLSSIETADKIIVINHGKVEQNGKHSELMEQEGLYRQLVQRQMKQEEEPVDVTYDRPESVTESGSFYGRSIRSRRINVTSPQPHHISHSYLGSSFAASSLI